MGSQDGFAEVVNEVAHRAARERKQKTLTERAEELALWMEQNYALGEIPSVRRKMYKRVAVQVLSSDVLWTAFLAVVELAKKSDDPGRYFSHAITVRIAEVCNEPLSRRFRPPQK